MKGVRLRFFFWLMGAVGLFLLANTKLRPFPHILFLFWLLLPLLSVTFSYISGRHISRKEELNPLRLQHGEEGEWILELRNDSSLLPFFLHFPFPSPQGKSTTEVMIAPGEVKRLSFPFTAPYTGTYTFSSGEPIFEDLLGFFKLQFSGRGTRTAECFALPQRVAGMSFLRASDEEEGSVLERRSLTMVTDDLFSVDPIQQGEPLSHTHWKLSSRLQKWMIKHYSDVQQQPIRLIVDVKPVSYDGAARFIGTKTKMDTAVEDELALRTAFLDRFYTMALTFLENGVFIDAGDRYSHLIHLQSAAEAESLGVWIAHLPFSGIPQPWRLSQTPDRRQFIWIQVIDEATLGSLLQYERLGIDFLIFSERAQQTQEILSALSRSSLDVFWLDEEGQE